MTVSLSAAMRTFEPQLPLGVACSAGVDSTALLVACARKWPGKVVALHVNHHLQVASAAFEHRCRLLSHDLNVEFRAHSTDARARHGQSPEDAARRARYKALHVLANQETGLGRIKSIALAQHADDQVETILLAWSRGAGLAGLSAMPAHWTVGDIDFHRPLLEVSRSSIEGWLQKEGIQFVLDPMNADPAYTRNRIRAHIAPAIEAVFPFFRDTFSRSARHCAEAQQLLDEIAMGDLKTVVRASDGLPTIDGLQKLNPTHQANVLRYWLKSQFEVIPSTAQLAELQRQIYAAVNRAKSIHIKVAQGFAVRQGEVLNWYNPQLLQRTN